MADEKIEIETGVEKYFKVIIAPVITEKSVQPSGPVFRDIDGKPSGEQRPTFAFWVDMNANKTAIKNAVENIFKVKVEKVRTIVVKGKTYRSRWRKRIYTPKKKAIVSLQEGETIDYV